MRGVVGDGNHDLAVDGTQITGKDVVFRYGLVNPVFASEAAQTVLREAAKRYVGFHGPSIGEPLLMIYDIDSTTDFEYLHPERIPSEVIIRQIIPKEALKIILVPARVVAIHQTILKEAVLSETSILPLELLELDWIETWRGVSA